MAAPRAASRSSRTAITSARPTTPIVRPSSTTANGPIRAPPHLGARSPRPCARRRPRPPPRPPSNGRMIDRALRIRAPRRVAGEVGDIAVRRRQQQLLGRADLDDPAVAHDRNAISQAHRLVEVVGDEDDGLRAAAPAAAGTRSASRAGSAGRAPRTARRETRAPARPPASARSRPAAAARPTAGAADAPRARSSPTSSIISRARRLAVGPRHALQRQRKRDVARARSDAAAAQSAGTPCPCAVRRSSIISRSDIARRSRPSNVDRARRSARSAATGSAPASTCPSPTGP